MVTPHPSKTVKTKKKKKIRFQPEITLHDRRNQSKLTVTMKKDKMKKRHI